ncbi:MAG: STAS domain-containing protein, partial [Bacteroidales bacterium]|nr:STAS domain-containing protein [Bacteroidales bacterium]
CALDSKIETINPKLLILDFTNISFMDSSGIGLVMGRYKLMQYIGGSLKIINPSPHYKTIRKPQEINEIKYKDIYWNNQIVKIAVDSFDNLLTDLSLFDKLYKYKAENKGNDAPTLTNQILVQLATNRPTTYEEIMDIYGFGEKYWLSYGQEILKIITQHLSLIQN